MDLLEPEQLQPSLEFQTARGGFSGYWLLELLCLNTSPLEAEPGPWGLSSSREHESLPFCGLQHAPRALASSREHQATSQSDTTSTDARALYWAGAPRPKPPLPPPNWGW
jgi:hypothetical protein